MNEITTKENRSIAFKTIQEISYDLGLQVHNLFHS